MIKYGFKRIIIALIFTLLVSFSLIFYISYSVVKQFIYRRIHKEAWIIQTQKFNELLRSEHGGQPISFTAKDGINLAGLLFLRPQAQRNLLLCHGYSRGKERLFNLIRLFPDDNILIFDYRAHGESQGHYTTIGFYEKDDVLAAFNYLKTHEKTRQLPIFGIGVSMGAVSLLAAAAEQNEFKGIVVDSAFKQLDEQIAKIFPEKTGLPLMPFIHVCNSIFSYMCSCRMSDVNSIACGQRLKTPIFIIHSNHDAMADVAAAHALHDAVSGHKKLWIVDHAIHARIYKKYPQEYIKRVSEFFNSI